MPSQRINCTRWPSSLWQEAGHCTTVSLSLLIVHSDMILCWRLIRLSQMLLCRGKLYRKLHLPLQTPSSSIIFFFTPSKHFQSYVAPKCMAEKVATGYSFYCPLLGVSLPVFSLVTHPLSCLRCVFGWSPDWSFQQEELVLILILSTGAARVSTKWKFLLAALIF